MQLKLPPDELHQTALYHLKMAQLYIEKRAHKICFNYQKI
jgi:hypothetical protein